MTDCSVEIRWEAERVLAIAPHPDDDVLACGGTLARAAAANAAVCVLYVTDGSASHLGSPSYPAARLAATREEEALAALRALGLRAGQAHFLREPDTRLAAAGPRADALAERIAAHVNAFAPTIVFSPWIRDAHGDHVAASRAVRRALAREAPAAALYEYTVWLDDLGTAADAPAPGEVERFAIDVRPFRSRKARAIQAHRTQLGLVIDDARAAFTLPPALLRRSDVAFERFFRIRSAEADA